MGVITETSHVQKHAVNKKNFKTVLTRDDSWTKRNILFCIFIK